ncbi:MAG: hypothetical protein PVI59_06920 [Anaerolineae bacterium]|jgi:hypothetical protein
MTPSRRQFIKSVGVALGSLALARCMAPGAGDDSPRGRVRDCWSRLSWLEEQAQDWDHPERGEEALDQLRADHRAALDDLVAAGALDAGVATEVQAAFEEAAYHVWRANAPITCYEPVEPPDYVPAGAAQLARQAEILVEMAEAGSVAPEILAQAQAAIERDVAFLSLTYDERTALYEEVRAEGSPYPTFNELDLEIPPEAAEAARFLIDLLVGKTG